MKLCYIENTLFGIFYKLLEMTIILVLIYLLSLTTKKIFTEYKRKELYDLSLLILSIIQLYFCVIDFLIRASFLTDLISLLLKLTQCALVTGCLLFQFFIIQKLQSAYNFIRMYVISIGLFELFYVTYGLYTESVDSQITCKNFVFQIIITFGLFLSLLIFTYFMFISFSETQENFNSDENGEINSLMSKQLGKLRDMHKFHIVIVVFYMIYFFIEFYNKFILNKILNLDTQDNNTLQTPSAELESNTYNITKPINITYSYQCEIYSEVNPWNLFVCFFIFLFKDVTITLSIYFAVNFRIRVSELSSENFI